MRRFYSERAPQVRVVPSAAGAGAVTAATVVNMMNSYFEQGGFYGQTAGTAATASPADQAAYRFPLGLGMGVNPYSQHNAAAAAAAAARPQDSAYAAAAAAAAELAAHQSSGGDQTSPKSNSLYSPLSDSSSYKAPNSATAASAPPPNNSAASTGSSNNSVSSAGIAGSNDCKDQNGYSSLSKDVNNSANSTSLNSQSAAAAAAAAASSWSSSGGGGGSGGGNHVTPPPRPSADTPDHMSRYTPTAADVAARERWMNTCSLTQSAAAAQQQMHAQASSANHTFYPWMAIAGKAATSATTSMNRYR